MAKRFLEHFVGEDFTFTVEMTEEVGVDWEVRFHLYDADGNLVDDATLTTADNPDRLTVNSDGNYLVSLTAISQDFAAGAYDYVFRKTNQPQYIIQEGHYTVKPKES